MPAPTLLGEYRNQHGRRQYPFADDAPLTDGEGQALPTDFLIDAFLYPIDLVNSLYLSKIDLDAGKIYFADTVTDAIHGVADFTTSDTSAHVYEDTDYARQIGTVVFGDGLVDLFQGELIRDFVPESTPLCPTVYIPLNQEGVRGFRLEDGTLFTGAVEVEGGSGVTVTSQVDMQGRNILKFDIIGTLKADEDECGYDCPLIQEICLHRIPGSLFMVSEYDDCTAAINSYGFTLEDICTAQRVQKLPDTDGKLPLRPGDDDDPCEPPIPPVPPDPGPEVLICFDVTDCGGNFFLLAPSTGANTNAVSVQEMSHVGLTEQARVVFSEPVNSAADALDQVENFTDPPRFTDGLMIGFKGLAQYRRQNK